MEIGICMILAFILGAYIRKPFLFPKQEVIPPPPEPPKLTEEEEAQRVEAESRARQLVNMLNFNGRKQNED
jgi:hypothetical protein